ncbi:type VI secretion system contractile sheath large subunit [Klebsiella michiganensis]|uniref:type VI secretion system contractile sheath large subunit n=1 Tax=Klebsiella TaxID=570 RepID=UPI001890C822|nr:MULTISPECIES: type VI secretion system contractile sheath large subunit [Klebsiella]MBS6909185.1 type VI secretion system contractile sheath large subunit [Klebsiella sp.]MDM4112007.1 type VI secretion system contractile sheath large subunit [Klebsiella michiganensis]MDM4343960.1 type VI secretion system contractile sheath large subunit [Klebsiella michiganensis]MDM4351553.1 type VI secretion system contractile sheath large subunit [Klebsiella michiganensis]
MLMSVNNEPQNYTGGATIEKTLPQNGVYASLFNKINLTPVAEIGDLNGFEDNTVMAETSADARVTAAVQVFMQCLQKSGQKVEKLDKTLLDHHIAELDFQISRQLDEVMHSDEFQKVESVWRGLKALVDKTDFRQNVKIEILDLSKDELRQDFEDSPEIIQSGLYRQTYTMEYDTPGGEPIAAVISAYEFDASAQDVALMRNISKVSAAAHMPFIGSAGPAFFLKENMEQVAAIKDIGNYFDRAEYIKWKSFRETDDSRYLGLVMPRVLGRLPYGPDTVPVRSFNYVEEVKGPDHDKYLWTNASFAFAANMVKSFINNGWCVQIRGPQAGGAVQDLPIHLYDLGTGKQVKIPSEVMIPETREFEFANLGFIPLSYYKNRDYACFFSANSTQKPALYDTADATANSRINARLPYIFLLSRIAHYLKLIQRENIGTTKDRRLLELELNTWVRTLVTEMTDPGDELQASHPLRDAKVVVEDIEDNPGFFRVKLYAVPHFQVEGMDVNLSLVSRMPKAKS